MARKRLFLLEIFKCIHFPYRKEKGHHHIILSEQSGANEFGKILQDAELNEVLPLVQKTFLICLPLCSLQRYLNACF